MSDDPIKRAWRATATVADTPALEAVRAGADKFYRLIWWRNLIEYSACVVVVAVFGAYVFTLPHPLQKVGSALVILGTFYAAWQLHRRASAQAPETAGTMPIWVFARSQLVRHRDALRGIFGWYILPFLPGLVTMMIGNGLDAGLQKGPPIWARWLAMAGVVATLAGIWWLNQLAARRLQRHIDEIDALMGEGA